MATVLAVILLVAAPWPPDVDVRGGFVGAASGCVLLGLFATRGWQVRRASDFAGRTRVKGSRWWRR